jgi:hypothetical protein
LGWFVLFRLELRHSLHELLSADLGTPGAWYLDQPFHVFIRAAGFNQYLHTRKKHLVKELAHLASNLFVEGLGSDRRLFLLFSGFLLGLELFVVFIADTQLGLGKALVMILGSIIDRISIARRTMSPCDTRIESNITPACLA